MGLYFGNIQQTPTGISFPSSGLTSYWNLDSTGGTTAYDSVGSIDGTLSGCDWAAGKHNNGVEFTNSTDKIDFGNNYNFDGTDPFTYSFWLKRNGLVTVNTGMIGKQNAGSPYTGYNLYFSADEKINFNMIASYSSNLLWIKTSNAFSTTGSWYHIVLTYDGTQDNSGVHIYVNNTDETFTTTYDSLSNSISNPTTLKFGTIGNGTDIDGIMDEIGVWDRELSDTEVTQIYNSGDGRFYTT